MCRWLFVFTLLGCTTIPRSELARVGIQQSETRVLKSSLFQENFELHVWLPMGYAKDPGKRYPVIFLTDSDLQFPVVSYVMSRLIKNEDMPEAILIGIGYNTTYEDWYYTKRVRDLTPVPWDSKEFHQAGGADKFTRFLENEVFPFVEKNYRVQVDNRTLIGQSFGGLYAHDLMLKRPQLFQKYLIVSPSIWFGQRYLLKAENGFSKTNRSLKARVYTSVGGDEPAYFVEDWKRLNQQVLDHQYAGLEMKTDWLDHENHRSVSPRAFTNGLRYLFQTSAGVVSNSSQP
jgi:uncharacterized protein